MAALAIDLELGLVFVVATPIIVGLFWWVMARLVPLFQALQTRLDRIALIAREGLSGMRVIRAFARQSYERKRFNQAVDEQTSTAFAVGLLSSVLNPATFLVMNLAICVIVWQGGGIVEAGGLTQGDITAFVNYLTQTLLSVVYVANLVVVFTKAGASAQRINEVLACEPAMGASAESGRGTAVPGTPAPCGTAEPGTAVPSANVPALRFRSATFAYPGAAAPAVRDVSLEVPQGATLGIIGGTGSGKSSLVNLIPRLYDVTSGAVEMLGRDVRAWSLEGLRRRVGVVPQQASLVSGTIRSNLCWRNAEATDDELWDALACAQVADVVRALPAGLDAPVEAGGKNFSGGQRQRLTIARALVGAPALLILDDSSSALDFKTDAALRRALAVRARTGANAAGATDAMPLTRVIVSQRVSTVRDADVLCVMRRGVAVGIGTHDELLRTCDVYREICLSQLRPEDLGLEPEGAAPGSAASEVPAPGGTASADLAPTASAPKGGDRA